MNKSKCIKLIKLFEYHKTLWGQDGFTNNLQKKEMRNAAWQDISDKLNIPIDVIKRKIKNLRGIYRKEVSRARKFLDTDEVYESKWFAYKHMSFLADVRYPRNYIPTSTKKNPAAKTNTHETSEEIDDDNIGDEDNLSNSEMIAQLKPFIKQEEIESSEDIISVKYISNQEIDTRVKSYIGDTNDVFGNLVAAELRKYDNQTLTYVKKAIMDIIFQADLGNIPGIKREPCED